MSKIKLVEYEKAQARVNKGVDFIDSLELIIKDYKNDKDIEFKEWANVLDSIKEEIEQAISDDVEIVEKYEKEEYEDEVRCLSIHEF